MKNREFKKSKSEICSDVFKTVFTVILIVYVFSLLIPIFWMIFNSMKGYIEYYDYPTYSLPKHAWSNFKANYSFIFSQLEITRVIPGKGRQVFTVWTMLKYSLLLSVGSPVFSNFVCMLCAYVIAKYKFPGSRFLYTLGLVVMILPIFGGTTSLMILRKALNIYDNMLLMILTAPVTAFSGLNFLMFYAAFKAIPWDYAEAIFIDGGGHFRVLVSIMLPMVFKTYGVLCLLGFLGQWSDYSLFLIWLPSYANLAYGLYMLQNDLRIATGVTEPQIFAAFVIVAIPTRFYI